MNTSFWSQCQGLVCRLQQGVARRRLRTYSPAVVEPLEARTLLSSTPAMIADINPGPGSGSIGNLVTIGSTTYFTASDGVHGAELWRSDGTAAGTKMVKDINPTGGSYVSGLTEMNGALFFRASDGTLTGLWKSDGTAAGTIPIATPNNGPSDIRDITNVDGTLYFGAYDSHGYELWKSDGTTAGTTMVKDISPGGSTGYYGLYYPNSSDPHNFTNVNGTVFFSADDGSHGYTLWKSDGTEAGTVPVFIVSGPGQMTNVDGTLFFTAYDRMYGLELWKSDGTTAGSTLVKDILPGESKFYGYYGGYYAWPNSSNPLALTAVNGTLFFTAYDGHARNLWRSDGTEAGTVTVTDFSAGGVSYDTSLTNINGTLYFSASDGTHGYELWKSDGTATGTILVKDIFPGGATRYGVYAANNSFPSNLTSVNGKLLFTANDGVHGTELWALNTIPAPSLDVTGFPATTTAGAAGSFTVTARNADDSINTAYTGTIHFTSSDLQAVLPADYTFTAADHGVHTFTATLKTAGYQSIAATDTQSPGNSGAESSILVKAAAFSAMKVSGFPSTTTAGQAQSFTVTLTDAYGNAATGYTGTVHFSSTDPKAVLPANYKFTAADAGKHTFFATLKTAGTRSITATDTLKSTLTGTESGITVTAAAASKFLLTVPSSVKSGVAFNLTLTVQDAYGNVVTGYTGTVHFTSSDGKATLPANYTFTSADKGVHNFTGLILRKKGKQSIKATDTLNSSLTASVSEQVR